MRIVSSLASLGSLSFACFGLLSACGGGGGNPVTGDCASDRDCEGGALCVDGACVELDVDEPELCDTDFDCDDDQVCTGGVCAEPSPDDLPGESCSTTSACELDRYCDTETWTCRPMPEGWCREDAQCTDDAPFCSASSANAPGRCIACRTTDDCREGFECASGACREVVVVDAGPGDAGTTDCPDDMHETAPGVCVCDEGLVADGVGGCREDLGPPGICPPNAHPVPAGGCACDDGFVVNIAGTGCVDQTSCPSYSVANDEGACECIAGYTADLDDGTCVLVPGGPCPENSTDIGGGQCVCNDGYTLASDFQSCVPVGGGGSCTLGQFACTDGACISSSWECDGWSDCSDGSDEQGCSSGCLSTQFECTNGTCISGSWQCDGITDCFDGSDEQGCGGGGSCVGFCGTSSPDDCWCDSSCSTFGDCCSDYLSVCF